uniref:Cytochrome P450 n=1 Tax=Stomoxys calcitrans TaxID=35570 RepID=A0A1I8NQQ7_STOCA
MNSLVTFLLLVVILLILLYAKYRQKIRFWKRHGVESISLLELYKRSKKKPWGINLNKFYQQMYAEKKPFKVIELLFESLLLVQDLEAIKDIMITNFESFPDRGLYVNHREALSANVSRLDYDMWKPLRMKMSPTFSPAKLRHMFPNLLGVAKQLVAVLGEQCDDGQGGAVQMFDLCARFTTDIIGNVAFGIECNSLREPNTEFRVQGNRAFYQTLNPLWDMIGAKFPKLMALFNVHVFSREANEFFKKVFRDTMEHRQKNNIRRNDFMDLLLELQKDWF